MTACQQSIGFAALLSPTLRVFTSSEAWTMRIYQYEEFLLGNATLHLQVSTALAVMSHLICHGKHPPSAARISESLGISVRYLRKLMRILEAGGLLRNAAGCDDTWTCAREPHRTTLADIYQCLVDDARQKLGEKQGEEQERVGGGSGSGADLLIMQATMSLNQLVLQHLRQFDLGRLKVAEPALAFSAAMRRKALVPASAAKPEGYRAAA
jgi:DNA-binding IscR family transcriptional regulator